jgi:hypothetical protein
MSQNGNNHEDHYDQIAVVNVVDLQFAAYQRGINYQWVDDLARMFDEDRCDPIVVSKRKDGSLFVISGQHRTRAAIKAGVKELLARVLEGLTYEQEADYFFQDQKNRRGMRPTDAWNASLEAEHPNTVEINTIVHSLGGRVNRTPVPEKGINCPHQLWKIHDNAGSKTLYEVLNLLNESWPEFKLGGVITDARFLAGMTFFVVNHEDEFKRDRVPKALNRIQPQKIRENAQRYRDLGRKADEGYYLAIVDAYNKGLVEDNHLSYKKCDWRSIRAATRKREGEENRDRRILSLGQTK